MTSGGTTSPARINGAFLDEITHDIPAQSWGPAEPATGAVMPRDTGGTGPEESAGSADPSSPDSYPDPRDDGPGAPGDDRPGAPRDDKSVLAVDLGGTKVSFAVIDSKGAVLARSKRPSHEGGAVLGFDALAASATDTVLAAGLAWPDVRGVGVVVPGIYNPATGRAWAPNLWGRDEVSLLGELRPRLPARVVIDSDRSGYVLGEAWRGAAQGCTDVVFLAVGTGIGAGILSHGRLVRGHGGIAGAVGWFALDPRWRDEYGRMGAFEAEAAGPALARRLGAASAENVTEAARGGDPGARRAVEETVEWLAMGTANLISAFNPQVVVLGGGLMQAADLLVDPVRRAVRRWAQPLAAEQCRIELTRLGEDAALFGAARLAFLEEPS